MDVFVDIWNHTEYEFDDRHHRGIMAYMREHDITDRRAMDVHQGSGRGRTGGTQSRPQERDAVEEVEEFLAEEARRAEARGSEEGGAAGPAPDMPGEDVVMTARGKMPVESGVEGVPQGRKRQRRSRLDEVYNPDGQAGFRDTFLQWAYDDGIPFAAFRRQSWLRHKKQLASMPRGVRPVYPSFKDIGGAGIDEQRGKVAAMLREVCSSFESIGATILSDGRQSRDARPIVNFLAAAKHGALLYATVQRDGSLSETAQIVLRRWKAIFRSFPPKDVLAICTDSASNYTSAANLLAKDSDPNIRRITWLPCATHVANLMLSDIGTRVPWVTDTIFRARALVRFIKSHGEAYHLFRLIRCADFWRNVQHAAAVMTPVHQLLRRLDRGGMIMSTMYSWSQELVRQVAAADVPDDMRGPSVEAVQIRTMHMLEPAHAAAHLLNPRRRSLRYYESARRTAADLEVVTECNSFLLAQTSSDRVGDAYLRVREQMRSFHSRVGHHKERVTRDVEAEACVGDEETSRSASWWVEHGACFPDLQEIAGRGGGPESVEELHARMDREEEQRLEQLQREWVGRDKYIAEQQRARDLEMGTAVRDEGGVQRSFRTVPHAFPADAAIPDTAVPETSPQGDVDSGSAVGGELGASEYGDATVSDVIIGLCAAGTLQPGDAATQEAVPMDDDSGELDGGRIPDAEGDDGAGDADRLAPAHSTGPGRSTHGSIGVDACGPVQGHAHVDDAGGSMSWALVLRHPSPVAHKDMSHPAEGRGGVDEEGEGGTADDRTNPERAKMEEGQITPGLLDPDALHRAAMEDPIITRTAGSVGVVVRSPPLYTPLSPLYSGSPASLEREQQRSKSIRAAASGARTTRIPPVTPPPPTMIRDSPTTVTGRERERGHMSSSSSPRLDTQQSLHRSWSTVRRVDDGVWGDFAAHQALLSKEQRPAPSLRTAYHILGMPRYGARRGLLLGSRMAALALYTSG
ncbi:hypothetical protein CBR_g20000 [Chara braunii]|uniref:DUF659 domain-containing protein n=1 Tax=Chara braunii TaxID=69332 RepID=A0A388KZB4_CHABU|nr:hypothetical protein CBR_g20000 [Chara braunii]|eukprot:GBG75371.1 hypothetical protein CBR_g20000 [Chara braunii]